MKWKNSISFNQTFSLLFFRPSMEHLPSCAARHCHHEWNMCGPMQWSMLTTKMQTQSQMSPTLAQQQNNQDCHCDDVFHHLWWNVLVYHGQCWTKRTFKCHTAPWKIKKKKMQAKKLGSTKQINVNRDANNTGQITLWGNTCLTKISRNSIRRTHEHDSEQETKGTRASAQNTGFG